MLKKIPWDKIVLMLISLTIAFVIGEIVFRKMIFSENESFDNLRNPEDYADVIHYGVDRFYPEDYWKLNFLFNREFEMNNPQPLLGWKGWFNPGNYLHNETDSVKGRRPVLLFGDSFAMCVDEVDCFEDILNRDTSFTKDYYFLNYGVGGYGVDQIYLLMQQVVPLYENPIVIFSMLSADMDRSMLKMRDGQKPYFTVADTGLVLNGTPITLGNEGYVEENPPEIWSYLYRKVRTLVSDTHKDDQAKGDAYAEEIKALNGRIIEDAVEFLEKSGNEYFLLLFHTDHFGWKNWRMKFIRDKFTELKVPYIGAMDVRYFKVNPWDYNSGDLVLPDNGHPTTLGNEFVAEAIHQYIRDSSYRDSVRIHNQDWHKNLGIRAEKISIYRTADWLENIRKDAEQKGMTLDSLVTINADYMYHEGLKKDQ